MENPEGRWFSFSVTGTDFVILEKKTVPQHLQSIENLDTPCTFQALVSDLEDCGEASLGVGLPASQKPPALKEFYCKDESSFTIYHEGVSGTTFYVWRVQTI